MAKSTLPLAAIKLIERAVDQLFDKAKARYLGPQSLPKRIYVGFRSEFSLPGIFHNASREERAIPDKKILDGLIQNAGNYLDAYRAQTKANVVKKVQAFLREAEAAGVDTDLPTVLGGQLADVWAKTTHDVKRLIDTEATGARNMGALEGIVSVNASEGIEDPVVYWVVVRDQHLCDECKRLHLLEDEVTPRCWFLSEVGHGYHKKGEGAPKVSGLHPHCRCTMVTLMPGYGFDAGGMVRFKSLNHDEIARQRGLKKSESLVKSLPKGIQTYKNLHAQIQRNIITHKNNRTGLNPHPEFIKAVKSAPVTVNFPPDKIKVLHQAGRLKNLFEIGDGGGETHAKTRALQEERVFRIPHPDIGDDPNHYDYHDYGYRPLYGALHYMHGDSLGKHAGGANGYGYAWLKLKPHVNARTTFTHKDSFGAEPDHVFDYENVHHAAELHQNAYARVRDHYRLGYEGSGSHIGADGPYIEAQIHGGVKLNEDVEELHLGPEIYTGSHAQNAHEIEKHAKAMGRKYGIRVIAHRPPDIPRPAKPDPKASREVHLAYWDALRDREFAIYEKAQEHVLHDPANAQLPFEFVPDKQKQADQALLNQLETPDYETPYDPETAWGPDPTAATAPVAPAGPAAAPKAAPAPARTRTSRRRPPAPAR